jgi:hypothetical protein
MIDPLLILIIISTVLSVGAYIYAGVVWVKMKTFERWIKILQMPTPKVIDKYVREAKDDSS